MSTGLTNVFSNVGQISYLRGEWAGAARHWQAGLTLARDRGDVPIGLEILTRAAKLWSQQDHAVAPLKVISFVLKQPALLAETRAAALDLGGEVTGRSRDGNYCNDGCCRCHGRFYRNSIRGVRRAAADCL